MVLFRARKDARPEAPTAVYGNLLADMIRATRPRLVDADTCQSA